MKNFSQKIPLAISLGKYVKQEVYNGISNTGQVYPCTVLEVGLDGEGNSIVTVNFEVEPLSQTDSPLTFPPVTMPIASSEYVRLPVKIGDTGIAVSASVRLGGISGLGIPGSLAPVSAPSNLGALVFLPISSALWNPVENPEALYLQGWDGVVIQDMLGDTSITLTPAGVLVDAQSSVTVMVGGTSLVISDGNVTINSTSTTINGNLQVNGTINSTGDISAGTVTMETHTHKVVNVQGGTGTITTTVGEG
jgi:hypothetical protein